MTQTRRVILLFSLAALALSGAATWVHYQLLASPAYVTPCDINATFNCTQVYLSPYGSVAGVPVAIGGILWAGLVALLAAGLSPAAKRDGDTNSVIGGYLFVLGLVGVVVSAWFAYVSFAVLGIKCIFCLGTYACVLGVMWGVSRLPRVPALSLPTRLGTDLSSAMGNSAARLRGGVLVVACVALAVFFVQLPELSAAEILASAAPPMPAPTVTSDAQNSSSATTSAPAAATQVDTNDPFVQYWHALPVVDTGIPAGDAKVVVIKFQDFMCPTCKLTYEGYQPVLDRLMREMPGAIKYVEMDYPLEAECNPGINGDHFYSCEAAAAVRMARKAGKGPAFEAWVWANQASLTTPFIKDGLARIAGVTNFDEQYAAQLPDIQREALEGQRLQIFGTPTFFIANRSPSHYDQARGGRVPDTLPPDYFERAIRIALAEASQ